MMVIDLKSHTTPRHTTPRHATLLPPSTLLASQQSLVKCAELSLSLCGAWLVPRFAVACPVPTCVSG